MLEIRNLHKSLGGKHVLRGVNLVVEKGEALVVIGGSGCGKSVMLKHILGLMKPDQGSIHIDGRDIAKLTERELYGVRQQFGMLFQAAALFDSMTVADNVSFALDEHSKFSTAEKKEIVAKKLGIVGLPGVEKMFPADLSGGMKKRVALARAIAADPDFLLYDEPTTGLDPIMSDVINELIVKLKKTLKVTSIVVTHDMASARKIADRIAMLHEGTIRIHATPDEVYASDDPIVKRFINGQASEEQMKEVWGYTATQAGEGAKG
ncbi:MAG: ABC transporter ATP-binding protein [Planctomycetes bacterium]|nr:ABC transporter ATP-binding protein [Planctomycetota bacterium]